MTNKEGATHGFVRSVGVPPTRSVVLSNGTNDGADGPEAHSTNSPAKPVQPTGSSPAFSFFLFPFSFFLLLALPACTTTAAKKALNKPTPKDRYSGFDADASNESKRVSPKPDPVKEDTEPEKAVTILVENLQRERAYAIPAEEQLKYWGAKQGVDKLVVSKVRLLLKHPRVEVRAPALRLTCLFSRADSNGDLVECLADEEYGIRAAAYKSLRARTGMDFGFNPSGGEVARARAIDEWRQWWQGEQRRVAVQPPSVYELNKPSEPRVIKPGEEEKAESEEAEPEEAPKPAPKPKKSAKADKKEKKPAEEADQGGEPESKLLLRKGESSRSEEDQ